MTYDKGHQALYQGYYAPQIMEQVSKMMSSMKIGSAQIRDLAVNNAHIKDLKTDKLVAGEIKISPNLLDDDYVNGIYTSFELMDGKIESKVTDIYSDIGVVSTSVTQLANQIIATVEHVDTELGNFSSELDQQASYITSTVAAIHEDIGILGSSITQTADEIRSEVDSVETALDGKIAAHSSSISQLSSQITTRITSAQAESIFQQSASSFTFQASQINFSGQVFGSSSATFIGSINTSQDINVGNNINLGNQTLDVTKGLHLARDTSITGNYNLMYLNSNVSINLITNNVNIFGNLRVLSGYKINLGNAGSIFGDGTTRNKMEVGNSQIWQDTGGAVYFRTNGVNRHTFASDGGKVGGSIELEDGVFGMSPIDSPRAYFFDIISNIEVNGKTKIYFHSVFKRTISSYDLFLNNPNIEIVEQAPDYFVLDGQGLVSIQVYGIRVGYEDMYYVDMTKMSEDMDNA